MDKQPNVGAKFDFKREMKPELQWQIRGGGGPPAPPLLLDQTEATRAFWENAPPPPPTLSQGLDDTSCYCTDTGLQLGDPAPLIGLSPVDLLIFYILLKHNPMLALIGLRTTALPLGHG